MTKKEFQKGIAKIIEKFNLVGREEIPDSVREKVEEEVERLYRKAARDVRNAASRSLEQNFSLDRIM